MRTGSGSSGCGEEVGGGVEGRAGVEDVVETWRQCFDVHLSSKDEEAGGENKKTFVSTHAQPTKSTTERRKPHMYAKYAKSKIK